MIKRERFALNRIIYPHAPLKDFIDLALVCGISKIELRNDLEGGRIIDSLSSNELSSICKSEGVEIISVNAVQKFNLPANFINAREEIKEISSLCNEINCSSIVLCPNNEIDDKRTSAEFLRDTIDALNFYASTFRDYELTAYIEPLGFPECSIRTKRDAMEAIQKSDCPEIYKIIHDTFHHFLSSELEYYFEATGLVHISGVSEDIKKSAVKDEHRILINCNDKMDSLKQIHILEESGYPGLYSFEPFATSVQKMSKSDLIKAVNNSLNYIISR